MTDSNPTSHSSGTPTSTHLPPPRGGPRKRNNNNNHHHNNNRPQQQQQQHNNNHHQRNNNKRRRPNNQKKPAPPPKPLCSVCSVPENAPSYKCPKCRALYCSVACCKQHKEVCKGTTTPPTPTLLPTTTTKSRYDLSNLPPPQHNSGSRRYEEDDDDDNSIDEGWKITDDMKEAMDKSKWLHQELQSDGGLRAVLSQMAASSRDNTSESSQAILQDFQERYPTLRVFLDKLLVSAGVLERHEEDDDDESSMNDFLQRNWVDEPPPLTLKPIFRKSTPVFEPVSASSSSSSCCEEEESGESESSSEGDSSEDSSGSNEE